MTANFAPDPSGVVTTLTFHCVAAISFWSVLEVNQNWGVCDTLGMLPRPLYFPLQSSYSRRRSRNRRNSRRPKPEYERNIVSAFFALASAVLLAIAEAEPKWLHVVTGKCEGKYIGLYKVIAYRHPEELGKFLLFY